MIKISVRKQIWMPLLALLIVAGSAAVLVRHFVHNARPTSSPPITITRSKVDLNPAPAADNSANETRKTADNSSPTLTSGKSGTSSSSVHIVSAALTTDDRYVHVGTMVNGTTSGTCTLTASKLNQPTLNLGSKSVALDVNNYDCGVYNIPVSTFSDGGTWHLTLTLNVNGTQVSDTADVTLP